MGYDPPFAEIDVGSENFDGMVSEAWRALKVAAEDNRIGLFYFGDVIVSIKWDPNVSNRYMFVPLTTDRLRYMLVENARFYRKNRNGRTVTVPPPRQLLEYMLSESCPWLPNLKRVVYAPVFSQNGEVICDRGYHQESGIYYDDLSLVGRDVSWVPDRPSSDDVDIARALLMEDLFGGFPFVSYSDRARAIALLLLPFALDLINGPTPLHMIIEPGDDFRHLLFKMALLPGIGYKPDPILAGNDRELREAITEALLRVSPVIFLDYTARPMNYGILSMATSSNVWTGRLSGKRTVHLPVRCVWLATSHFFDSSRIDIERIVVRIHLDSQRGQGLKHYSITSWAEGHRTDLIWAALVLIQNWLASGRPYPRVGPFGLFEEWTRVMGGILECAGIPGFLDYRNTDYRWS